MKVLLYSKMFSQLLLFGLLILNVACGEDEQEFGWKFLNRYRYISRTRSGNHDVPTAIKNFQRFFRLRVTGKLDPDTLALMHKPRCGMPDVDESGRRVKRYSTYSKWPKTDLTYFFQPGPGLYSGLQEQILAEAFKLWSDKSKLTFKKASSYYTADIKISFRRYSHGCSESFDGPGGTLAHAFFPTSGLVHFDQDETFTHQTRQGTNLLLLATHEIGHALGLQHVNIREAIMYPYHTGYVPGLKLHSDDIAGIQSLYGANTGTGTGTGTGCIDQNSYCQNQASSGYCQQYPDYMTKNCRKSCNLCA